MPYQPGHSGNPGGRRPPGYAEFQKLCRTYTPEAMDALLAAIRDPERRYHVKAIELLLAYAHGKPKQAVDVSGELGGRLEIVIKSFREVGPDAPEA